MKQLVIIVWILFLGNYKINAQLAIGIEPFFRSANDQIGFTYGAQICVDYKQEFTNGIEPFFRSGFSMTVPQTFSGTATLKSYDSTSIPLNIYVPIEQKVTDYIVHFGGGVIINPKKKDNYFVTTFGLRGIVRTIHVNYLSDFDMNTYNSDYTHRDPFIPGALNLGFNLGLGYWYEYKHLVLFPNFSFGFGSGDNRNKHPWNDFPNYFEFGCRMLLYRTMK